MGSDGELNSRAEAKRVAFYFFYILKPQDVERCVSTAIAHVDPMPPQLSMHRLHTFFKPAFMCRIDSLSS